MKRSLQGIFFYPLLVTGALLATYPKMADAISIKVTPSDAAPSVGQHLQVAIVTAALKTGGPPSLSVFDLQIRFNHAVLRFDDVTGVTYGDPTLRDQLSIARPSLHETKLLDPDTVDLFEVSFDSSTVLNTQQKDSFTLATLTFVVVSAGTSPLQVTPVSFGDAAGKTLQTTVSNSTVSVAVPEPTPLAAFGMAGLLVGLALRGPARRRSYSDLRI